MATKRPSVTRTTPSKAATRRRAKRGLPASRFDGEALGLVLFALGIFLAVTVALRPAGDGVMARLHHPLLVWLDWGAWLLPLAPLCYGVLVFLGRDLAGLTRRVLGATLVALSLLGLAAVFMPDQAGQLAVNLMRPLMRTVGVAAALLPLLLLSLGVEIILARAPFSLAKGFFRALSMASMGAVLWGRDLLAARHEGQERARARASLRGELSAHLRDLLALEKLYPQARELRGYHADTRDALRTLGSLDEEGVTHVAADLASWREVARGFVMSAAQDLAARVDAEAPALSTELEARQADVKGGRHELSVGLNATMASAALERVRRALVMDLTRLTGRAATLERERVRALKALEKADAQVLARELPASEARAEAWAVWLEAAQDWSAREAVYPGWPDLAVRFDRAPSELAAALAQALESDADTALRERDAWERRLEEGMRLAAQTPTPAPVVASPPPLLDLSFDAALDPQEPETAVALPPAPEEQSVEPVAHEVPVAPAQVTVLAPTPAPITRAPAVMPWEDDDTPSEPIAPRPAVGALDLALPGLDTLDPIPLSALNTTALDISARQRAGVINETLAHFGLSGKVVDHARGPTVTRYEIEPAPGEKISRIASLANDLARALAVGGVRVEAPVPGKSVIGLEVPNAEREPVTFHAAALSPAFKQTRARLPIILGKSIDGEMLVGDLVKMPHLLIAGSTGSGKSVCVNTLITSLLFKYLPTELRFLMVDPKMVELTPYDGIPHLVRGVVTNPVDAAGVLLGAVAHMERRYKMMSQVGAKNLEQFNAKMRLAGEPELPHLVIIIDELADLMITSPKEVESAIMRLAQMARATGMHLVLATQRPSVDILTSLIKVNVPARIAFAVSSSHDSRTILDTMGAERLTGMGDMLFYQPGLVKPMRLQGPYISEVETARITELLRRMVFDDWFADTYGTDFDGAIEAGGPSLDKGNMDFSDPFLRQAAAICIEEGQGSVSRLQRRLSVGHARAGKLMDMLEAMGIVSKHQGSKPREVLITQDQLPEYFGR